MKLKCIILSYTVSAKKKKANHTLSLIKRFYNCVCIYVRVGPYKLVFMGLQCNVQKENKRKNIWL